MKVKTKVKAGALKMKSCVFILAFVMVTALGFTTNGDTQYQVIYTSQDLSGHSVVAEVNPGGGTSCAGGSDADVSIASFGSYGEVTSNVNLENIWVNAIGHKKFIETFPNDSPVRLGVYKYTGQIRLPRNPVPDATQSEIPEAVQFKVELWDGRDELWPSNKTTLEGNIYWFLNPWNIDYGKIKVYTNDVTGNLILVDTGIYLTPDIDWHAFEVVVDFKSQKFISITIDGEMRVLSDVKLAEVYHPTWGNEVAIGVAQESMAAWPKGDCSAVFTWTTQFRDLELSYYTIVDIDIKLGSESNSINLKSKGVIPVAILSTDCFDATTIDGSTVKFCPAGAAPAHDAGHLEDVNGDGNLDWVGYFKTQETGLSSGDTEASITGKTKDEVPFKGTDSVSSGGGKGGKAAPALNSHSKLTTTWARLKAKH
ncbi:MAG: hypothetical protein H8D67_10180 [Deltaproteobacteria bacterium]|nr:hypothetical protein [Deltaproteobacteria bacterium]